MTKTLKNKPTKFGQLAEALKKAQLDDWDENTTGTADTVPDKKAVKRFRLP